MALKFLGIWPNTPDDGSPTIWHESVIRLPANMLQFIPRPENLEMAAVEVSDRDDDSRDVDGGNSGT